MDTPHSQHFDDIYFAAEDGLAESRYVFLQQNNLPDAFAGQAQFVIAETGFGTGLNFLCAWDLFERTAAPAQKLTYYSFEKYPLSAADILRYLGHWSGEFGGRLERLAQLYPLRVGGWHRIEVSPQVTLILIFDDVNRALPELDTPVDCWFLDGHAPAKNPAMWSEMVFSSMGRLSRRGTRFATFTAAGCVRRGLEAAGFTVSRARGFGRKRDMSVGVFERDIVDAAPVLSSTPPARVAVIGAGMAGCAAAYVLSQHGCSVTIFDGGGVAGGASGNPCGLYNPRFTALREQESDFYAPAFAQAVACFEGISQAHDIGFSRMGCLHLITDLDKDKRFRSCAAQWGWDDAHMRIVGAGEASSLAGIPLSFAGLYLPDSGMISPYKLCQFLSAGIAVVPLAVDVLEQSSGGWRVGGQFFDVVVLCCGAQVLDFPYVPAMPFQIIRGQISFAAHTTALSALKTGLCYGGYCTPCHDGQMVMGSTFQNWLDHTDILDEDHVSNLEKLREVAPDLARHAHIIGGRAGLRVAAADRFPVIGKVEGAGDGGALYLSTAHGSYGILSSLMGAQMLAAQICGMPQILPRSVMQALSPHRFEARRRKRGEF